MTVALPVHMDEGFNPGFTGHRVQHHLTLGPTKGGLRYHPDVALGEVAALAMWIELEMRAGRFALRGRQRRHRVRTRASSRKPNWNA